MNIDLNSLSAGAIITDNKHLYLPVFLGSKGGWSLVTIGEACNIFYINDGHEEHCEKLEGHFEVVTDFRSSDLAKVIREIAGEKK